jgi:hypothetical protein
MKGAIGHGRIQVVVVLVLLRYESEFERVLDAYLPQ